jgi:arylsulfatase A-like enzyme/tetratricopeptide (TPR) repeat protein
MAAKSRADTRKDSGRPTPRAGAAQAPRRPSATAITIVATVLALAAGTWWWFGSRSFTLSADSNRNILLVTIDTLRADALGSYGGRAVTPNLDRLAVHGARFDFAHSHAVVTLVSHATMLTGKYPYGHGIRDNSGYRLAANEATAATRLKAIGFSTGAFVGGFPLDHRFGLGVGFDVYDDHMAQATAGASDSNDRERRADAVVASALDWIGKQSGKWFGWVHVYDPHAPYQPPGDWASRFSTEPYLGEVSWTDSALGPLLERLATQPRPTLVVVTGDHGESLGEHGELTHSVFAYEPTLHVPLIVDEIRPAGDPSGRNGVVVTTPVRHVDLLPTMLDAAGAPPDTSLPGTSLRDVIAAGRGPDRPSYFESMTQTLTRGWAPLRGVLVGREKFIDLPIPEIYDLGEDPKETSNGAASKPERASVLFNTLKGFNLSPPGKPAVETPDAIERLRSLGYIGGGGATIHEKYTEADDPKQLIGLVEQSLLKAQEAARQGRLSEAVELYKGVIAKRADTEDAYRLLALLYWRAGRPADAISTLELALRNGVTQSEVRIKLGQYLAESGQGAKAIALLESFAGDDPDALIALGNAYLTAGKGAKAIATFKHLLDVDPASGLAYENIGTAQLAAKDYVAAEASLRKALSLDPGLAGAYTALGVVLAETGRQNDAIDAWKQAVQVDPNEFYALMNLTRTLATAGRRDEARAYGERFIRSAPPSMYLGDIAAIQRLLDSLR